jgi:hypothetical protein
MKLKMTLLATLGALGLAATAHADAGWEFTSAGNSFTNGTWDFATAFTVNQDSVLTGLGYYADPVTGNVDSNAVALYQCADAACLTTGTLLASATVINTYAIDGHFRYVTVTPVDLVAGQSYEVAGVSNSDNYTWNDRGFAVNPAITLLSTSGQTSRWANSGTPGFLTGSGSLDIPGEDGIWGPNIFLGTATFTNPDTGSVPEPGTWAMMLVGFGLIGLAVRRRNSDRSVPTFG